MTLSRSPAFAERGALLASSVLVVTLAWLLTAQHGTRQMLHPHLGGIHALDVFAASAMWLLMMIAMMLPAVFPWVWVLSSLTEHPYERAVFFLTGYFSIWGAFSVAAALAQILLQQAALLGSHDLRLVSKAGGALLLVAGAFQLTPLKAACLSHCRSPLGFFLARWHGGPRGAFDMGLRHGVYCLACCWALMLVAFALGVMNLLWMGVLTLVLCLEKVAPGGEKLSRIFGIVLLAWGLWLLLGPPAGVRSFWLHEGCNFQDLTLSAD